MIQRYGLWRVTTEGDVEGRSTRSLGEFKGNFDEIAFHLADKCYYTLEFDLIDETPRTEMGPTGAIVNVRVSTNKFSAYGTRDREEQTRQIAMTLSDTNVGVEKGNYYESVTLKISKNEAEMRRIREEAARNKALLRAREKLTNEELKLLGIK